MRLNYTANKRDDVGDADLVLSRRIREPDLRADAAAKLRTGRARDNRVTDVEAWVPQLKSNGWGMRRQNDWRDQA